MSRSERVADHAEAALQRRKIPASAWSRARFQWASTVRRDARLTAIARLLADELALGFANAETARCDPSFRQLASALGCSWQTIKRAAGDLEAAGYIAREPGAHRGQRSSYTFLARAEIVPLKGVTAGSLSGEKRGSRVDPLTAEKGDHGWIPSDEKGGQPWAERGSTVSGSYNIDKPYKNHKGARDRDAGPKLSENPLVRQEAESAVARWRDGRSDALADLRPWVRDHILAAGLLTAEELDRPGLFC